MANPFREGQAPQVDEAIGSIRVASTLIAQFEAMAYSDASSIEDLELRIRQSQEIYPSIWQHLDDARRVLAARDRDVAAFDELRSHELGHLGVTDVETEQKLELSPTLMGGARVRYSATKSAAFNLEGIGRATHAARSLMRTLPEIDWAGLARAEDREIAAAGSLRKGRRRAIVKVVAGAIVVLVIAIVVRQLAMTASPAEPAKPTLRPSDISGEADHAAARARLAHLEEVERRFELTCDRTLIPELVQLLGDAGRPAAAARIENTPCTRKLPSCTSFYAPIEHRLLERYAFGAEPVRDFSCRGIVIARAGGALDTAFAVSITARNRDKKLVTYRGVISRDGEHDLVPFQLAPVPVLGVGDFDGDHADELVAVDGARLIVTRVVGDHFSDIDGPTLPEGCHANVAIEPRGNDLAHELLAITVDDRHPQAGCPATGRHSYGLVDDAIQIAD